MIAQAHLIKDDLEARLIPPSCGGELIVVLDRNGCRIQQSDSETCWI